MWTQIERQYKGKGASLKSQYIAELKAIDYRKYNNIIDFVVGFKKLRTLLDQVRLVLPKEFYSLIFIEALDSAFPIWAERWRCNCRTTLETITVEMLVEDITDEARDRAAKPLDTNVTLYANNPNPMGNSLESATTVLRMDTRKRIAL